MDPADRRRHVRGLLCVRCNYLYLDKCLTAELAERIAAYLARHRDRRTDDDVR